MTKPPHITPEEQCYRSHLIATMPRESLLTMIVREHLQARERNHRSWKNGTPLAELYAIPTERHA
jgi:hypothetical protein